MSAYTETGSEGRNGAQRKTARKLWGRGKTALLRNSCVNVISSVCDTSGYDVRVCFLQMTFLTHFILTVIAKELRRTEK
jgi:hypothetical protein